jgi:hypothetical protein
MQQCGRRDWLDDTRFDSGCAQRKEALDQIVLWVLGKEDIDDGVVDLSGNQTRFGCISECWLDSTRTYR